MSTAKDLPEDAPAPRLCHLIKWPDFDGYGFNLHGEKSKPGQYIGKVDKDSPAELAGLKSNDRIIEVNGTNISNENHRQVVQRIKAKANETELLVLDEQEDQYYKSLNILVTSNMPNVIYTKTPVPRPSSNGINNGVNNGTAATITTTVVTNGSNGTTKNHHQHDNESHNGTETPSDEDNHDKASHVSDSESGSSLPSKNNSLSKKDSRNGSSLEEDVSSSGPSPTPPGSSASPSPTPIMSMTNGKVRGPTLDLNMSVQEMRAKLAAKKKEKMDAKNAKIDLRKKHDIIEML